MLDHLSDSDSLQMVPVQTFLDEVDQQRVQVDREQDFFVLNCIKDVFDGVWGLLALLSAA